MKPTSVCGTLGGYEAHRRRGESPCEDCRDARRVYDRSRKRSHLRGPARGLVPPPPADIPRCRRRCGRLVWHFDTGLCGACARGVAA